MTPCYPDLLPVVAVLLTLPATDAAVTSESHALSFRVTGVEPGVLAFRVDDCLIAEYVPEFTVEAQVDPPPGPTHEVALLALFGPWCVPGQLCDPNCCVHHRLVSGEEPGVTAGVTLQVQGELEGEPWRGDTLEIAVENEFLTGD